MIELINNIVFRNLAIIFIILILFFNLSINLNIFLGLILFAIIVYFYRKNKKEQILPNNDKKKNYKTIEQFSKYATNKLDINDFLFSIQDFYVFNPQAFEELIYNIDVFFKTYEKVFIDNDLCNYYFQIAQSKKNDALNSLHSILFNLPNNKLYTQKLDNADQRLETLLNIYLNKLYQKCTQNLMQFGLNIYKKQINIGPKEYNTYSNENFSYQFY